MNTTQGPVLDNNASPGCTSLTQRLENGTEIESAQNYTWCVSTMISYIQFIESHCSYPFDWKTVWHDLKTCTLNTKSYTLVVARISGGRGHIMERIPSLRVFDSLRSSVVQDLPPLFYSIDDNPLPDFVFWQNLAANDPTSELAQRGSILCGISIFHSTLKILRLCRLGHERGWELARWS